jgi:multidrug efflux system outer membrane protein
MKSQYKIILFFIASTQMVACKVFNPYKSPDIAHSSAEQYTRNLEIDSTSSTLLQWQEFFSDTSLQSLIHRGLNNNTNIKNAIEQLQQAQASFRQSKLALLPNFNFTPTTTYNKTSRNSLNFPPNININLETTTYQLGFSSNWELDIWGKLASAKRMAYAEMLRSNELKNALQTQIISTIAQQYYTLLALDEQRRIIIETIANREKGVETMKALKKSAIVNGAAVVQSEANLYSVQLTLPDIEQSIREIENSISTLIGEPIQTIQRSSLIEQNLPSLINKGIPVAAIQNRPDIKAAELAFKSAFENTNYARTFFYPSFSINAASIGISSLSHNPLWSKTSIFGNVVGGVLQPVFNKGLNRARLKIAKSQQEIALNNFYQNIIVAGQEITDAVTEIATASSKTKIRTLQINALEKAVDFTKELLKYSSSTNYTDVLTSEQSLLSAQINQTQDQLQMLIANVNLYKALGGGSSNN